MDMVDAEDELEADRPGDKFNPLFEGERRSAAFGKCQSKIRDIRVKVLVLMKTN
jgi:hypothetical protein